MRVTMRDHNMASKSVILMRQPKNLRRRWSKFCIDMKWLVARPKRFELLTPRFVVWWRSRVAGASKSQLRWRGSQLVSITIESSHCAQHRRFHAPAFLHDASTNEISGQKLTCKKPLKTKCFQWLDGWLRGQDLNMTFRYEPDRLSAVDTLKDFPNDSLLGARATILLRIDWLSG
jgi:hypothetical protein